VVLHLNSVADLAVFSFQECRVSPKSLAAVSDDSSMSSLACLASDRSAGAEEAISLLHSILNEYESLDPSAPESFARVLSLLATDVLPPLLFHVQRDPSNQLVARVLKSLERAAIGFLQQHGWAIERQTGVCWYVCGEHRRRWPPTDLPLRAEVPEWIQSLFLEIPALISLLYGSAGNKDWPVLIRQWLPAREHWSSLSVVDVHPVVEDAGFDQPAAPTRSGRSSKAALPEQPTDGIARHLVLSCWGGVGASFRETESDLSYAPGSHLEAWYTVSLAGLALLSTSASPSARTRMLVVGVGGGALPAFIGRHWPHIDVDAVEIDARVLRAATEWFGLLVEPNAEFSSVDARACGYAEQAEGQPCRVHCADAIDFVSRALDDSFDCILLDVYTSAVFPPALLCADFFQHLRRILRPPSDSDAGGSLIINAGLGSDCRAVMSLAAEAFNSQSALVLDCERADVCLDGQAQENGIVICGALPNVLKSHSSAIDSDTSDSVELSRRAQRINANAVSHWRSLVQQLPSDLEPCPFELKSLSDLRTDQRGDQSFFLGWRGIDVNEAFRASQRRAERAAALAEPPAKAAADDALWACFD
jgi:hypothetical protein